MKIVLAGLFGLLSLMQEQITEEQAKKVIPFATDLKRKEFVPSEAARAAFKKATGADAPGKLVLYEAQAELFFSSNAKSDVRIFVVSIETAKGAAKLGVCVVPGEKSVAYVKLLEHSEEKSVEEADFFAQFMGFTWSDDAILRPSSDLDMAVKRAGEAKDDDAKALRSLLTMARLMKRVSTLNGRLSAKIAKKDASATEAADLSKILEEADPVPDDAKFLKSEDGSSFKTLLSGARKRLSEIDAALKANEFDKADAASQTMLVQSCNKCHGSFQTLFRERRDALGIGNGYFQTGFDLVADPKLAEKTQAGIATGVRKAVLLLRNDR